MFKKNLQKKIRKTLQKTKKAPRNLVNSTSPQKIIFYKIFLLGYSLQKSKFLFVPEKTENQLKQHLVPVNN